MQLLSFLLENLFFYFTLPLPSEVCSNSGGLKTSCTIITSFSFLYFFTATALLIFFAFKPSNYFKKFFLLVFSTISLFVFSDYTLKELTHPNTWGLDLYLASFYFWCFLSINIFIFVNLFPNFQKKLLLGFLSFTFILTIFLGFLGRGTEEALTPIFGTILYNTKEKTVQLSFIYKISMFLFIFALIYSLLSQAVYWVKTSKTSLKLFFQPYIAASIFLPIVFIPLASYFIGSYVNKNDVADAKSFIEEIKKKTDRYFLENGEYPRIVEDFIGKKKQTPWLLKRHEYFSFDIPATYYFSRADKYCFIFQNPNHEFGYYSITSTRNWRYIQDGNSFDNLYLSLCDETENSSEDLIAGRMGLEGTNDFLGELGINLNKHIVPAISNKSSKILHNKIIEYGEKDPTIFKYYGNSPKKYRDIYDQPKDVPAAEEIK